MSGRRSELEEKLLEDIKDLQRMSVEVWLGYNVSGDLVQIRKKINGVWYKRVVELVGVTDLVVDTWDKFGSWAEV